MAKSPYYAPEGGLSPQSELLTGRAVFKEAYAVIPKGVMQDIVTSRFPFWEGTRAWVLARPLTGFAETFSQCIVEVESGGGSDHPETDSNAEAAFFVVEGGLSIEIAGKKHQLLPGGFAFVPAGQPYKVRNKRKKPAKFHWIRKSFESVEGLDPPDIIVTNDHDIRPTPMPGTDGRWATTRFFVRDDVRYDMHVTIVTLEPGAVIPFLETHVMEHGLYVLEGKGVYRLNEDWVEVEAGDFMWLRAFCPQACYAGGPDNFRYLLYKDVNRHPRLPRFR